MVHSHIPRMVVIMAETGTLTTMKTTFTHDHDKVINKFSTQTNDAWQTWLSLINTRCHFRYKVLGNNFEQHTNKCLEFAESHAKRTINIVNNHSIHSILEPGCSIGFNCFALAKILPNTEIWGIDPDEEAIHLGKCIAKELKLHNVHLQAGVGENITFNDNYFDLIISNTIIEHVNNVEQCISEMGRVLKKDGKILLDAPNYIWPYEPHLEIIGIPMMGKLLLKICAILQGEYKHINYLNHLKFVNPFILERIFRKYDLTWENLVEGKIKAIISGDMEVIKSYKKIGAFLNKFGKYNKLCSPMVNFLIKTGFYPSVSYLLTKHHGMDYI